MTKNTLKSILAVVIIALLTNANAHAQNGAAIANADTTNFSVNAADGWILYNSYVATYGSDSIQMEIIIQHSNNIPWSEEHYVGKIKTASLKPAITQNVQFALIADNYTLKIENDGKCYLKFISGNPPGANPAVIPINIVFKK